MKENFYIKQIEQRGKIKIWIVNGAVVRRDLDEEFTNFGQHFRHPIIPEYEFWLDKEAVPDEKNFFIDHLLIEWKLMKIGYSYNDACDVAEKKELSERKKTGDAKKIKNKKQLNEKIHIKLLKEMKNKIKIWIVDGRLVRDFLDIEFTEGGHDFVYDYVPKNEIWLDNDITEQEKPFVLLHELNERLKMEKGENYNTAHYASSELEWEARHNKKELTKELEKLGCTSL
ncbi:hypothetical protein KKG48_03225 [Patescibacteria group bacterium]|nr:hypothetical protein [Patescibacteria group bacterium]